jgi:putative spermidine/putrescine transport system permease protein
MTTLINSPHTPADAQDAPRLPRRGATKHHGADVGPSRTTRVVVLSIAALFLGLPLFALGAFTVRGGLKGGLTLGHWHDLFGGELGASSGPLWTGLQNSLLLSVVTVVVMLALLVPTMILVRLHLPRLEKTLEFVCLLPLTIPAVALVVGLAPVFSVVARIFGSGSWTLAFAYVIVTLPYSYRAIQANLVAVDVVTLAEAARSLGASWTATMRDVLLPNLRRGMLAASFISIAVVLGEFTIASLLSRTNLQTALVLVSKQDPYVSNIIVLMSLLFALVLLFALGRVGTQSRRSRS